MPLSSRMFSIVGRGSELCGLKPIVYFWEALLGRVSEDDRLAPGPLGVFRCRRWGIWRRLARRVVIQDGGCNMAINMEVIHADKLHRKRYLESREESGIRTIPKLTDITTVNKQIITVVYR